MTERDEERDERIEMEIIVDAYTADEQAYGWHAYLDDTMEFPFEARCTTEREESPLKEGKTVRVVGMSSTKHTLSQMPVTVEWMDRELGVPLEQLEPISNAQASSSPLLPNQQPTCISSCIGSIHAPSGLSGAPPNRPLLIARQSGSQETH